MLKESDESRCYAMDMHTLFIHLKTFEEAWIMDRHLKSCCAYWTYFDFDKSGQIKVPKSRDLFLNR